MLTNKYVEEYIQLWHNGEIELNDERVKLIKYLKNDVLKRSDVYFDEEQIENCISFIEKWYFPTQPFQRFIIAFVFLIDKEIEQAFFTEIALFMGRGGGKNGFISAISDYLITPLHGTKKYDISIVANSEEQAKTSFNEVRDVIIESKRNKTGKQSTIFSE